VIHTLPAIPGISDGVTDRDALLAALTFMEGSAAGWALPELYDWFVDYASMLGRAAPPSAVSDVVLGLFPLQRTMAFGVGDPDTSELLTTTRRRVALSLRGLVAQPSDDRFLQAAIFAGRVRRERRGRVSVWAAFAQDTDHLSDIVLSLFVVDVLAYREFYEQNLCICDVCGRVSFNPSTPRAGCADHVPARDAASEEHA
jgi:hypothetical protein